MAPFPLPRVNRLRAAMAAALLLAACVAPIPIREVINNPREYNDKTVTVEGRVSGAFSLLVVKYFTVDDGTGSIGVITERPLPRKGKIVKVTGTVKEAFSLGDQTLTVLMEHAPRNGSAPIRDTDRR